MCHHAEKTVLTTPALGAVVEICLDCPAWRYYSAAGTSEWFLTDPTRPLIDLIHEYNARTTH